MAKHMNKFNEIISNSVYVVHIFWTQLPFFFVCSLGIAAMTAVLRVLRYTIIVKAIIDTVQYGREVKTIITWIAILFVFSLIQGGVGTLFRVCVDPWAKQKLRKVYQGELFQHSIKIDLCHYDTPQFYDDYIFAMSRGLESIWSVFEALKTVFTSVIAVITLLTSVFSIDMLGALFGVASVVISFFFDNWRNERIYLRNVELVKAERMQSYVSKILSLPEYAKEIRIHKGIAKLVLSKYEEAVCHAQRVIVDYSRQIIVADSLTYYLSTYLLIYGVYCGYLAYKIIVLKTLSLGDFVGMYQAVRLLRNQLMMVTYTAAPTLVSKSLYISKCRDFLKCKPKIAINSKSHDIPQKFKELSVKKVDFSYGEKDELVLKDINMNIPPNSKIAIVGYNGSGKSTLVKLLVRLYDITAGGIFLNDIDIRVFSAAEYRSQFGTVFQDFQTYATTIAENVVMNIYNDNDYKKVLTALEKSGIKQSIMELDNNINTQMTREFYENGVLLSGGEIQKLAISRVIYSDAKCIIMDEPSSALDPVSEYEFNKLVYDMAKDKMVIYISHRLSTTVLADYIYMFENGEIVEQGTHVELMTLGGKYAYMFNLQAKQYIEKGVSM